MPDETTALRALEDAILAAALPRVAHVVKPWPAGASAEDLAAALANLRRKNLVHGPARCPNLTPAGVEAAKQVVVRPNAKRKASA